MCILYGGIVFNNSHGNSLKLLMEDLSIEGNEQKSCSKGKTPQIASQKIPLYTSYAVWHVDLYSYDTFLVHMV